MDPNDKLAAAMLQDPLKFTKMCWPEMTLYDKQREVLLSVKEHPETFVHAANQTGKTRIAAIVALWFFLSRTPARVIVSSSSETQLSAILWNEILQLIRASALPLPLRVHHLKIQKLQGAGSTDTEHQDYILGHVTNSMENFQGHHLPGDKPRVLAIFDEASGVDDVFYEAAQSWAHRKLVIGNPLSTTNFFYHLCKAGDAPDPARRAALLRKVIHIDGHDSPNVQIGFRWSEQGKTDPPPVLIPGLLTYDEFLRRKDAWDEPQRTARLHGHFYEGDHAMFFPTAWLDRAMDPERWRALSRTPRRATALGVDVASGGRDNTCWTLIDEHGVIEQIVLDTPNTMEIPGRTIRLIKEHDLPAERVVFDAGGGGKQIVDRLAEQSYGVLAVGFGEGADAKGAYLNRRAEMYGELREMLTPGRGDEAVFALPPEAHALRQELAVLPMLEDSEGKLRLPPKQRSASQTVGEKSIRQLLGRSPDRADSLALAVWGLKQPLAHQSHYTWMCVGPGDPPMTEAEKRELPPFLKDLVDVGNSRSWLDDKDDDDDEGFFPAPGPW